MNGKVPENGKKKIIIIIKKQINDKNREVYYKNKEARLVSLKKNYEENREERLLYQKEYSQNNKDRIRKYQNKYKIDRNKNDFAFKLRNMVSKAVNFY